MVDRAYSSWSSRRVRVEELVKTSTTYADVLRGLGLKPDGNNPAMLQRYMKDWGICFDNYQGTKSNRANLHAKQALKPLSAILVQDSTYSRGALKKRLLKDNILEEVCALCGLQDQWQGVKLTLILDHINGVRNDHRLSNLRLLCPNCNSQQNTFAGKNLGRCSNLKLVKAHREQKVERKGSFCGDCGIRVVTGSSRCAGCNREMQRKCARPTLPELEKLLWDKPTEKIAFQYGVSDKTIEKWSKQYGLTKPGRGYWAKKKAGKI